MTLVQTQEIEITKINNSPGILPFKLGISRIISGKHTFLHEINLKTLEATVDNLIQSYKNLNSSFITNKTLYKISLTNKYEHLEPLIQEVSIKFNNIYSNFHIRQKRGLINLGGTVQKWLFGTLNAEDGERYDKALTTLKQNQQKIVTEVNNQISLSKQLIDRYSKDIEIITNNQKKISKYIDTYLPYVENMTDQFYKYTAYLSMIDQIFINSHVIINFLDNLENSITFAKLHTVHPDILTPQNLEIIISELKTHHKENEILNLKIDSWYSIIQTSCYFYKDKIIFSIEIPIANPKLFQYFHLFPLPTNDNNIIIPPNPFLALETNTLQYMDHLCPKIEDQYICNQENFKYGIQDDCIASIIQDTQDKKTQCVQTPVHPPTLILNRINDEYLIVISHEEIKLKVYCPDQSYLTNKGTSLFKLPINCTLEYEDFKFGVTQLSNPGKPLVLPLINKMSTNLKTAKQMPLKIDNIPLEDIHELQRHIQATNQLTIEDPEVTKESWTTWTILAIILIIIAFFTVSRFRKLIQRLQPKTQRKAQEQVPVPSVLFQNEVPT